jgi:hypothetical protein
MMMSDYFYGLMHRIEDLSDAEFDRRGWAIDPDLDLDARDTRDEELLLDLTGNLDSCA